MPMRFSLATLALVAAHAAAQVQPVAPEESTKAAMEVPVTLDHIDTMRVVRHGYPGGFTSRACNGVASLTAADFSGGTYTMQAGFSQGESLSATYTLQASEFPIKIDLAEAIFATSGATSQTTTHWAISFYQGTPQTGTLVQQDFSDDTILPHLRVGPGTAGVNLQFSVDPNDPDQIIINDNGSHTFSVAWTVVQHNQPSSNPCLSPNPTCCNAFPVTDNTQCNNYTQLNNPTVNWLFGVNCGPFGCPANGGWARFSNLSAASACQNNGCRPRGDWVTRVNWSTVNCVPVTGACCLSSGTCTTTDGPGCTSQGGTYQGDNTACAGTNCPQPTGACCTQGVCSVATQSACTTGGGTWQGANTTCAGTNCPQPTFACCLPNGFCLNLTSTNCTGAGGTWYTGSVCATNNVCPLGACCLPNGSCITGVSQNQCTGQGGTFRGVGSTCAGANCPQPTGACCFGTFCIELSQSDCNGGGGTWRGALTTCADSNGNGQADQCEPTGPTCDTIDFNHDSLFPDTADIDDFLSVFSGGPCSTGACGDIDFNNDTLFPDTTDIDALLSVFSGGPCM